MRFWKNCVRFYLGGGGYVCLELLWRGRSHGSMFFLGGICFGLIGWISRRKHLALPARLILAAGGITALELLTGLLVNRDHAVWDYRGLPYNYLGQICLKYSLLWIPVSLGGMLLHRAADRALPR